MSDISPLRLTREGVVDSLVATNCHGNQRWTDIIRAQHARNGQRLPSDLTDDEWAVLEPFFPDAAAVGRPRKWTMRRILDALLYLLRGGLPWRMLPPGRTVENATAWLLMASVQLMTRRFASV